MVMTESDHARQLLLSEQAHITNLAQVEELTFLPPTASKPRHAISAVVSDASSGSPIEIFLSTHGVVDPLRERERIEKEIAQVRSRIEQTHERLQSDSFVTRAPANVVQKERDKLAELGERLERLEQRLASLQ